MSQFVRNTSIAQSKLGPIRMPSDKDPSVWQPGPVITYRLSPEEVAAKYGEPTGKKAKGLIINKEILVESLKSRTVGQVAIYFNTTQEIIFGLVERLGLELDEKNRLVFREEPDDKEKEEEGNQMNEVQPKAMNGTLSLIEQTQRNWPKEKFEEAVKGKTLKLVAKNMGVPAWVVSELKKRYGLTQPALVKKAVSPPVAPPAEPIKCECCAELRRAQEMVQRGMERLDKLEIQLGLGCEPATFFDKEDKLISISQVLSKVGSTNFNPEEDLTAENYRYYSALENLIFYMLTPDHESLDEIDDDLAKRVGKLEEHARHHNHQVQNGLFSGKVVI